MATKVALAAALLVALAALATATRYTTTITTVSSVDESQANPVGRQDQCQQEVQQRQFRNCQRYLSGSWSGIPYMILETTTTEVLAANPSQQEQQYLNQCCQELLSLSQECQCEGLRHAVRQAQRQQEGGAWQGGQSQQVYQRAQNIPRECNFRERQCRIRTIFV